MAECAFCANPADSREHVFSDWMNNLLPGKKVFRKLNEGGTALTPWIAPDLNLKAKVVCGDCNKGWMSRLENEHAKPAMADLIVGKLDIPISQSCARSIAIFAFKTAVVLDHMSRERPTRFFSREARHRFRRTLELPHDFAVFMAGFRFGRSGACFNLHLEITEQERLDVHVSNYRAGHFVFQVVAARKPTFLTIVPNSEFDSLAVPCWPRIPDGFIWPPQTVIKTEKEFRDFGKRWYTLKVFRFTGD